MEQVVLLGSPVHCRDGKGGSLKQIVIEPRAGVPRLDYLIVQRGFLAPMITGYRPACYSRQTRRLARPREVASAADASKAIYGRASVSSWLGSWPVRRRSPAGRL